MKIRDGQDEAMVSTLQDACSTQSTCRDANEMKLEGTRRQGQARAGQGRHDGQRSGLLIGAGGRGCKRYLASSIQESLAGTEIKRSDPEV